MPVGKNLKSEANAVFDTEYIYDAADIEPMITYGTNPGMGIGISQTIPETTGMEGSDKSTYEKSLNYMGYAPGEKMTGKTD